MAPHAPLAAPTPRETYAHLVSFRLPSAPASVSAARAYARESLDAWGTPADVRDDAVLVTSELVTNAVAHAGGTQMVCRLRAGGGRLSVEVEDQARARSFPVPRTPGHDSQNGRGLLLVEALCRQWGVREAPRGHGRITWAELALPALTPAQAPPARDRKAMTP